MNQRQLLETEQKALEINLDPQIYGTFAEIGAGQEVARHFFQVGAAAGTIAKTMSAYDKVYSDQIYGTEPTNRYVCEARIYKMLTHEYDLMMDRLRHDRPKDNFFVFADTVAAINYSRTIKGNGWLGLRFQLTPQGKHNDLVLHVRMLDNDNQLQQQAIGILGVNMIYGAYHYKNDPETLLQSLLDNLKGRIAIDMVILDGPDFEHVDNRLLSLWLVKHGLTKFTMFDPSGRSTHPSEFLYRKAVMVVRGSFRPPTLVNQDMVETGYAAFREDPNTDPKKSYLITELTLDNLKESSGIDERDYLDRVRLLNALGQTVLISNYPKHDDLLAYLSEYKVPKLGIVLGVQQLLDIITEKYNNNLDGRLLAAFGEIFTRNVKIYVYPAQQQGSEDLMRAENVPIPEGVKFLYRHLLDNGQIVDIEGYRPDILHIFSTDVLARIENGGKDWEEMVPERVAELIKKDCLFGYPSETLEFSY